MVGRLFKDLVAPWADHEDAVEHSTGWDFNSVVSVTNSSVLLLGQVFRDRKSRVQVLVLIEVGEDLNTSVCHENVAGSGLAATVHGKPVPRVLKIRSRRIRWRRAAARGLACRLK